jgi:parallel beta-helix repeat protein
MTTRSLIGIAMAAVAVPGALIATSFIGVGGDAVAAPAVSGVHATRVAGGLVRLHATATSGSTRVRVVNFVLDGRVVGSDSTAPFSFDWNPADLRTGSHVLRAVAATANGASASSKPVSITTSGRLVATRELRPGQSLRAALAALPKGGGSVHLAPGVYRVQNLSVRSGVHLIGSGAATILRPAAATNYESVLNIRGKGVTVRGLTVDGNATASKRSGGGRAIHVGSGARDVVISRVRIVHPRKQGVYLSGDHQRISVQDSVIDGGNRASAGVMDQIDDTTSGDTSVLRTTIRNMRDYGINFFPWTPRKVYPGARAVAIGNVISHIQNSKTDNGTNESGIWTGGVDAMIRGNVVSDTGWDGIQTIGMSRRTVIAGNRISRTGVGIYLEHETWDTVVEANTLTRLSNTGINVEWRYDGKGSGRLTIRRNRIVSPGGFGVFVDVGANNNLITANVVSNPRRGGIRLQGSTGNLVSGNTVSGTSPSRCLSETTGLFDDGRAAHAGNNTFRGNTCR